MPDGERALVIGYAPATRRDALAALLALDARLGGILRGTREPMVGQMRLTWWHDALTRLDGAVPPAEPVLMTLATTILPLGITGAALATMIDGWEVLLDDLDDAALTAHACDRGGRLFALAGRVLDTESAQLATAGQGWALVDLAANLSDPALAARARAIAGERLDVALAPRWPMALRALGALAHGARMRLAKPDRAEGHPLRIARLLRHRLTGR